MLYEQHINKTKMKNSTFRKITALTIAAFAISANLFAQEISTTTTTTKKAKTTFLGRSQFRTWSVGINAGMQNPFTIFGGKNDFDARNGFIPSYGVGISVEKQLGYNFGLRGDLMTGGLEGENLKTSSFEEGSFKTTIKFDATLNFVVNFGNVDFLKRDNKFSPFASFGFGLANFEAEADFADPNFLSNQGEYVISGNTYEFIMPVGVGVKYALNDNIRLKLGYTVKFMDGDKLDASDFYTNNDRYQYTYLGATYSLGKKEKDDLEFVNPIARMYDELEVSEELQKQIDELKGKVSANESEISNLKKDSDGDGVADLFDKEPNTPAGSKIDGSGRTLDTDGDGIPDYLDKCPTFPGDSASGGCMMNGVGVNGSNADGNGGYTNFSNDNGMSGNDGMDGNNNGKGGKNNGKGNNGKGNNGRGNNGSGNNGSGNNGSGNNDGSGNDSGLGLSGPISGYENVQFDFDSFVIKPISFPILDKLSEILTNDSKKSMYIDGHASAEGSDLHNMQLSKERAFAVKSYLLKKGVPARKITTRGFGESKPVVPNSSEEGRIKNRRVEFKTK